MGRGTHRGFITYEELSKSLGKRNLSDENLAQAFIHILDEKVSLVEKKSDYKVLRKKESSSKEEGRQLKKATTLSECTLEKWVVSNFFQEKVKSRLQKG